MSIPAVSAPATGTATRNSSLKARILECARADINHLVPPAEPSAAGIPGSGRRALMVPHDLVPQYGIDPGEIEL
jgi:hypothetical protein